MTTYASLNGARVTAARVTIPYQGAWVADVLVSSPNDVGDASVLMIGDHKLVGYATRTGSHAGTRKVRIVGGGGGWRRQLKPKAYSNGFGVRLSSVIGDAARESDETLAPFDDRVLGTSYVRDGAKAAQVLRLLAPGWWVAPDGKTHLEPRGTSEIVSSFTVESRSSAEGLVTISTEAIADWVPGRTFRSPTITTPLTISSVSIDLDNDGKLRLSVLTTIGSENRTLDDLRAIVRDEMASALYSGLWEYMIASATHATVDAVSTDARMPSVTRCPMFPGLMGEAVTPQIGSKCLITFINADPARPICVAVRGGALEHLATVESVALLLYNALVALTTAIPALPVAGVAASTLALKPAIGTAIATALAAQASPAPAGLAAQIADATSQLPGFATGLTTATTSAYFASAISGLSGKTDNVSGSFPSIGCPSLEDS